MLSYKIGSPIILPCMLLDGDGIPVTGLLNADITVTIKNANGAALLVASGDRSLSEISTGGFSGLGYYEITVDADQAVLQGHLAYVVRSDANNVVPYRGLVKMVSNEESDSIAAIAALDTVVDGVGAAVAAVDAKVVTVDTVVDGIAAEVTADTASIVASLASVSGKVDTVDTVVDGIAAEVTADTASLASTLSTISGKVDTVDTVVDGIAVSVTTVAAALLSLSKHVTGKWQIHTSGPYANCMVFYDTDGTTVLAAYDLQDSAGAAATTNIFARIPR